MLAREAGALVVRHCVNVGLGGVLGTGISAALSMGAHVIVTCNGDGRHSARDVLRVAEPVLTGRHTVAIGSGRRDWANMPLSRRVANGVANIVTFLLFGVRCSDSQ